MGTANSLATAGEAAGHVLRQTVYSHRGSRGLVFDAAVDDPQNISPCNDGPDIAAAAAAVDIADETGAVDDVVGR